MGMIAQWAGSVDAIPEGWLLCDGQNGTPDLRDKFVVAAGAKFPVGAKKEKGVQVGLSHSWPPMADRRCFKVINDGGPGTTLHIDGGEPVPAHFALAFIMRQ